MTARTAGGAPIRAGIQWRYLPAGRVVHALTPNDFAQSGWSTEAECGHGPWSYYDWMGTGSQREYDTAAELRPCRKCLRKLNIPAETTERNPE